ncbi:DEAD/DEAH box helicase [Halobacillus andaensis]|uniref:DEAD/DEAH box helicase n=1 Tax=Halobacillus andaensis TaxID=1176239 RepID=UPI003D72CC59
MRKRVSKIIHNKHIESWKDGQIVTIKAGTDSGKSHFIKNKLYAHARIKKKKILMFVNRKQPVTQFRNEVFNEGKWDMSIQTYQKLEHTIRNNEHFPFEKYDYIVCDEFHYFLEDDFNKWIDLSFNAIMHQTDKVRIFMSATGDSVTEYFKRLNHDIEEYELEQEISSIKKLRFFYKEKSIEECMKEAIENGHKSIFFIESAEKALQLHKQFPVHTMFNCGQSSRKQYKHVDQDKVNEMLHKERFEDLILITTTVMDTGVNIKDEEVKNILIDVINSGKIIQCLGRKRMTHKDDKANVYIKARNKKSLASYRRKVKARIEKANYFRRHGQEKYTEKYYRDQDKNNIVYTDLDKDGNIIQKVHELVLFKNRLDYIEFKNMQSKGYCKYIADLLGKEYDYVEGVKEKDELTVYLDGITGQKLFKEEKKKLIDKVNLRDSRNRLQKSIKLLNTYFSENKIPYIIIPKKSGNNRFWIIEGEIENGTS